MTAKEVLENLISTIEKNSTDNKATITNVDLWVKCWREELNKVNNSVLDDVNGACCENPKHKAEANEMFESWVECKNCGKEII